MLKKLLLILAVPLVLTGCSDLAEGLYKNIVQGVDGVVSQDTVEDLSPDRVFLDRVPNDDFENLTLEDFPSMIENYNWPEAAIWNDRVFYLSYPHVIEYDLEGNMVAYTNKDVVSCSTEMALVEDSLFIVCRNLAIYEVDLNTNKVVYVFFDAAGVPGMETYGVNPVTDDVPFDVSKSSGPLLDEAYYSYDLPTLENPELTADGDTLWYGTFGGFANINTKTHKVTNLPELNYGGSICSGEFYARNGDVWAEITAHAGNPGGLAHYIREDDSWRYYDAGDFKSPGSSNKYDYERIDFNDVIVSDEGVFVRFQDHGTDKVAIKKFNPDSDTWEEVYSAQYTVFEESYKDYLPPRESYLPYRYDNVDNVLDFDIYHGGQWKDTKIQPVNFAGMSKYGDKYYLVSRGGIYTYEKGDKLPKLLTEINSNPYGGENMDVFVTDDGKYLVYIDVTGGGMMFGSNIWLGAYNLKTAKLVENSRFVQMEDFTDSYNEFEKMQIEEIWEIAQLNVTYSDGLITINANNFGTFKFNASTGGLEFEPVK